MSLWYQPVKSFDYEFVHLLSRSLGGFERPGGSLGSSTSVAVDLEAVSDISLSNSGGATVNIRVISTMSQEACPVFVDDAPDVCARPRGGLRTLLLLVATGDTRGLDETLESLLLDLIRWIFVPDFALLAPNMHSKRSKSLESVSRKADGGEGYCSPDVAEPRFLTWDAPVGLLNEEEIDVSGCDPKYDLEDAALDAALSCLMEGTAFGDRGELAFSLRPFQTFVSKSIEGRS
jgi:hypothetical protein